MKYIRTIDGVYEITDKQYDFLCGNLTEEEKEKYKNITSFGIGEIEKGTYKSILIEDILKQAENLIELCDKFIDKTQHYIIENKEILSTIRTKEQLKNNEIYGAIWTDKGLIYVVKMNDKGELELC